MSTVSSRDWLTLGGCLLLMVQPLFEHSSNITTILVAIKYNNKTKPIHLVIIAPFPINNNQPNNERSSSHIHWHFSIITVCLSVFIVFSFFVFTSTTFSVNFLLLLMLGWLFVNRSWCHYFRKIYINICFYETKNIRFDLIFRK